MYNEREVNQIYRDHFGQLVASLVSYFGLTNIEVAEDLVQDTFVSAIKSWKEEWPKDPKSWLFAVCKRKTINHLNKLANKSIHQPLFEGNHLINDKIEHFFLPHEIKDSQLRLLFAFCHPTLSAKSQLILTLRMIAGFSLQEISNGLGISLEATKKNLTRTKQSIKTKGLQMRVPYILQSNERLRNVHKIIYLIFNEGYNASSGTQHIKQDLCAEAVQLVKSLLASEKTHTSETHALMALMLFNLARFESRVSSDGLFIELSKQNRSLWDQEIINQAHLYLHSSKNNHQLTSFHVEAAIASIHCKSETYDDTDWCSILKLYDTLLNINPSPIVKLNRCIALGFCQGVNLALDALNDPNLANLLKGNFLYHITLGKFYYQTNNLSASRKHFTIGHRLTKVSTERNYVASLIDTLT